MKKHGVLIGISILLLSGVCLLLAEPKLTDIEVYDSRGLGMSLEVDSSHLYWSDTGSDHIMRMNTQYNCVQTFARDQNNVQQVVLHNQYVYWYHPDDETVRRKPKTGGEVEIVLAHVEALSRFVIDDQSIYWTSFDANTLSFASKDGSTPHQVLLQESDPIHLEKADQQLFVLVDQGLVTLDLDTHTQQFVEEVSLNMLRWEYNAQMLVEEDSLYWTATTSDGPTLWKTDTASHTSKVLLDTNEFDFIPTVIAQDADYIYGFRNPVGTLIRINKQNNHVKTLIGLPESYSDSVNDIAVDDSWIYWMTDNRIFKAAKPGVEIIRQGINIDECQPEVK